jgi:hypothetical protein
MNVLPKSSVINTGVEDITSFKSENAKVASSFHTNEFFFKRDVNEPAMRAYIILNKFTTISCKTQKYSKTLDVLRNRPLCDSLDLLRVHRNPFP